jgi:cytidine deaminase
MNSKLFDAAKAAMGRAYAPYSRFSVGVALLAENGEIYAGCNVENASFPEGWCAETSALGAMVTNGATRIREVAVMAGAPQLTTPCGGCRQRLAEFGDADTPVHICGPEGLRKTFRLGDLLPAAFDKEHLG